VVGKEDGKRNDDKKHRKTYQVRESLRAEGVQPEETLVLVARAEVQVFLHERPNSTRKPRREKHRVFPDRELFLVDRVQDQLG